MEAVLIDTNVVVSFLHRRSASQQAQAVALFEAAARGGMKVLLHQHVLTETAFVLVNVYGLPDSRVAVVLADLVAMPGIERIDSLDDGRLLELWPRPVRDFGDAVTAAVALGEKCAVATFDRRFRNALRRLDVALHFGSRA